MKANANAQIIDSIMIDYIVGMEYQLSTDVINKLDILRDNGLAYVMKGEEYIGGIYSLKMRLASQYVLKLNPKLEDYIRDAKRWEYGNKNHKTSDMIPEIIELCSKPLESGTYFGEISVGNYMILKIDETDEDDYNYRYTIAFVGRDCRKAKDKFFKKLDRYEKMKEKEIYGRIVYTNGKQSSKITFKPFDKLIIKDKDKLIRYIDNWVKNIPIYFNEYGMMPKLSILVHGRPGTGKSTLAQSIAKHLDIDEVVSISEDYFDREEKQRRIYGVMNIEDIDTICGKRDKKKDKDSDEIDRVNNKMVARILSFLDNPPTIEFKAPDGMRYPVSIIIASTNYIDKLDDAIKRHGRFDLQLELEYHDETLAREFCSLFGLKLEDVVDTEITSDFEMSPAELQAKCFEKIDSGLKQA